MINSGKAFFCTFRELNKHKKNSGTPIIAKKCILISPIKNIRIAEVIADDAIIIKLFLLIFILNKYTSPPIMGINPMNGTEFISDTFRLS